MTRVNGNLGTDSASYTSRTVQASTTGGSSSIFSSSSDGENNNIKVDVHCRFFDTICPEGSELPTKQDEEEFDKINNNINSGNQIVDSVIDFCKNNKTWNNENIQKFKAIINSINKDNVAHVIARMHGMLKTINSMPLSGMEDSKSYIYAKIVTPMLQKAKELGINPPTLTKDTPIETVQNELKALADKIVEKENGFQTDYNNKVKDYNNRIDNYNDDVATFDTLSDPENQLKAEKAFDEATDFLTEVAYMNDDVNIEESPEKDWKQITLDDGRYIKVKIENNEITEIIINSNTEEHTKADGTKEDRPDVAFTAQRAYYDIDRENEGFEGYIKQGYDFEALKNYVKQILGME